MIAVLLASSAIGMAAPPTPVDWLALFTPVATEYWGHGAPPPCGTPRFAWGDTPQGSGAMGDPRTCLVTFNKRSWRIFSAAPGAMCAVTLHEFGHLYGHGHSEGGIMDPSNATWWRRWPACDRVLRLVRR